MGNMLLPEDHEQVDSRSEASRTTDRRSRVLRRALGLVRANWRTYLVINAAAYGLAALGVVVALANPELHKTQVSSFEDSALYSIAAPWFNNFWSFALTIFIANLAVAALVQIVLPSMIIPFAGLAVFAVSAFRIGITLAPVGSESPIAYLPHLLTLLIEFQAYVLVALGSFLLSKSWVWPTSVSAPSRRAAYVEGLRRVRLLLAPALGLLAIGALYEAFELLYIVPLLTNG